MKALDLADLLPVSPVAAMIDKPSPANSPAVVGLDNKAGIPPARAGGQAERRRHLRVDGPFEGVRLDGLETQVMIRDLSEGGCFIHSLFEERAGRRLVLNVSPLRNEPITVTGQVVHNCPGFGFAVRFVDLPTGTRASLARVVAAYARQ